MVHLSQESDLIFPGIRLNNMQKERKKLFEIGHPSIHFEENRDGIRIVKKQIKKFTNLKSQNVQRRRSLLRRTSHGRI